MEVKLISHTVGIDGKSPEELIAYCARVSNPNNQENPDYEGLLRYCLKHGHWSIFSMADATFEIETSRAIATQILRHYSFDFQEFSQRYSNDLMELEICEARSQDPKNRQNSVDDLSIKTKYQFKGIQDFNFRVAKDDYESLINQGVAKECARMLLPLGTKTRLYMKGSFRSWLTYLTLRTGNGTQKEHSDIADAILELFKEHYPLTHDLITYNIRREEYMKGFKDEV